MIVKQLIIFLFSLFLICSCFSQDYKEELEFVKQKQFYAPNEFRYYKRAGNDASFMKSKHKYFLSYFNPLSIALKSSMYVYQNVISPQLSKSCPYGITCSNFSKQAIEEFGIVKGVFISADRLMRCNRIALLDINQLDIDEKTGTIIDPVKRY
jgi:putative component of membrane protein insertase Oxa1/YidC/SpoIIIJ protein YidD